MRYQFHIRHLLWMVVASAAIFAFIRYPHAAYTLAELVWAVVGVVAGVAAGQRIRGALEHRSDGHGLGTVLGIAIAFVVTLGVWAVGLMIMQSPIH